MECTTELNKRTEHSRREHPLELQIKEEESAVRIRVQCTHCVQREKQQRGLFYIRIYESFFCVYVYVCLIVTGEHR